MPQDPFLIDQIDIEPGSVGTRRISRDAGTGGLAFQDAVVTAPITLSQLASLNAITNVFVVGKSGAGAKYTGATAIQDALDDVPSAASATNPYIILVLPGVYTETVNIVRDGVRLIGLGKPTIRSLLEDTPDAGGNDHTVIVSAQLGTIPLSVLIEGFVITNVHTNKAAVRVLGGAASTVGSTGIILRNCDLQANSAAGNRTLWAEACNRIGVFGGSWSEAANLGLLLLQEVASFDAVGVDGIGAIDLRYDTANDEPSLGGLAYSFTDCGPIAINTGLATPIAIDLDGDGAMLFNGCTLGGQADFSGDRSMVLRGCTAEALNLLETVSVSAENSLVKTVVAGNLNAELDLPKKRGTAVLGAATTIAVAFDIPFSDANYEVSLELPSRPVNDESPWVTLKATTGFTINFQTAQTMTVRWLATRYDV